MLFFIISLCSSIIGAICGIGGGVIIKPVLDMFQLGSAATINFLSGCTVLSMCCYSVLKNTFTNKSTKASKTRLPLAIGAVIGGIAGKQIFSLITALSTSSNRISLIQAVCLGIVTFGTLLYILNKNKIQTKIIIKIFPCILIGFILGLISSFLGIGGGPINLVVLYYFFSMNTKTAAENSLYIILFSQIASLLTSIVSGTSPQFNITILALMVAGGIGGGMVGHFMNKKMSNNAIDKLLISLLIVIISICIYNTWINI